MNGTEARVEMGFSPSDDNVGLDGDWMEGWMEDWKEDWMEDCSNIAPILFISLKVEKYKI